MDRLPKELHVDWRFGSKGINTGRYNTSAPGVVQRLWVAPAGEEERERFGAYSWQIDTWCVGWRRWNLGRRSGYEGTMESAQDRAVAVLLRMIEEGAAECGCCVQDKLRRARERRWEMGQHSGAQAV